MACSLQEKQEHDPNWHGYYHYSQDRDDEDGTAPEDGVDAVLNPLEKRGVARFTMMREDSQ